MKSRLCLSVIVVGAMLAWPVTGYAQEATIGGTVTDTTGGVMPGVTVTAVNDATGNTFFSVTDDRGSYRIPARIGAYKVSAELAGFATLTREGVSLQVGQLATVDFRLTPSGLQETVTVTGEAPLINTTQSIVGSNINQEQMSELPVQGRQWSALALLAPGNRTTAISENPAQDRSDVREFQLNMDGQQVTQNTGVGGQPRYSRDAIAEFQFISNRFDATQGRSSGIQVNAVSRGGTNQYNGAVSGSFRKDKWNAPSFITGNKVPINEQDISLSFGGPVLKDKLHFFANYELDRTPHSLVWTTGYPTFDNASRSYVDTIKLSGLRFDYQMSSKMHMYLRGSQSKDDTLSGGGTGHPAAAAYGYRTTQDLILNVTRVLNPRMVNEVRAGFAGFLYGNTNLGYTPNFSCFLDAAHSEACKVPNGIAGAPRITFSGFSVGGNTNGPQKTSQNEYTIRDDFNTSYDLKGTHHVKMGGEYLYMIQGSGNCRNCSMVVTANRAAITTLPKTIDQYLGGGPGQDLFDSSTWDLNALSPLVVRTTVGIGPFRLAFGRKTSGLWYQDDWSLTNRLTVNLGLRYDLIANAFANDAELKPWLSSGRPNDANNLQPRFGFAYKVNDRTVLRGGSGRYYGDTQTNMLSFTYSYASIANIEYTNPATGGRADFFTNPYGGTKPSRDEAMTRFCSNNGNQPGCLLRAVQELAPYPGYGMDRIPNSWQTSIGVQRQISDVLGVDVDYVQTNSRNEKAIIGNINVTYNPATGLNNPYTVVSSRVYQDWGIVGMDPLNGWSNYHGLQIAVTKRLRNRWQASGNFLLSEIKDSKPNPVSGLTGPVPFKVAPDLGVDYAPASTDQRRRATFNGIWDVWGGLQLSGLYFYGSGNPQQINPGTTDARDLGSFAGDFSNRRRANGELVPRNSLPGTNMHRIDLRLQQRIRIHGRRTFDAQLEVFNALNRFNASGIVTNELNIRYGQKNESNNIAYSPRVIQLGFRMAF